MSPDAGRPLPPVAEDLPDRLGGDLAEDPVDHEAGDPRGARHERRRLRRDRPQTEAEGLAQRLFAQWSALRDERERQLAPPQVRREELARSSVPPGLDLAAAWSWRFLLIVAAVAVIGWVLDFLIVLVVPIVISLLVAALAIPVVDRLDRWLPRGLAALLTVVAGIGAVGALLTFVGREVAGGAADLADSTVQGLEEIRTWLRDGPLNATDSQIDGYIDRVQRSISERSQDGEALSLVTELGVTLGHVFAGFFIVLFATYFFMADGARIWSWIVRLTPRTARARVDSSGQVAWISLRQFVRATVVVALVDAIGIAVWAAVLGLPFVAAIGVLVFLGAFVPMVGATVAGSVAVLVALVDQGPWAALLMLVGVIVVQQVEGHVLQPFLMGRWVSVHPLGVIVAIATGVLVAGVVGALVAVPLVAALNAVGQHLAAYTDPGDDPLVELEEDYTEDAGPPPEDPEEELERVEEEAE